MARLHPGALSPWLGALLLVVAAGGCSPGYVAADSQNDGSGGADEDGTGGTDGADGTGGADGATGGTDGATGGTDGGTGGTDGGSGGAEPGTGGVDTGTGGLDTGSGGASPGGFDSSCAQNDACIPAANFHDECFSPSCSAPVAATESVVESDPCLVPWEEREVAVPEECAAHDSDAACPQICEVQPPCVDAACHSGSCQIEICLM